jgi:hypothetical protein
MTNENAHVTAWTIVGVAVCAAFAFMVHGCVDMVKASDQVELQKRQACIDRGGSVLAGPNGTTYCFVISTDKK